MLRDGMLGGEWVSGRLAGCGEKDQIQAQSIWGKRSSPTFRVGIAERNSLGGEPTSHPRWLPPNLSLFF